MQTPQINLNGSDGLELAFQYQNAANAVKEAIRVMSPIVHGRDYQTLPDGSYERAREEMIARIGVMLTVKDQLEYLALFCAKGSGKA